MDIHENDLSLQKAVHEEYLHLARKRNDFDIIDCFSKGDVLDPSKIHSMIVQLLVDKGLLRI
jgi:hypothetical protein